MFLLSVLLSAITFNPAMASPGMTPLSGVVEATPTQPTQCANPARSAPRQGFPSTATAVTSITSGKNNIKGGTPLTIDVTETGGNGSKVFIYWVNATITTITITGMASANYYCPK